MLKRRLISLILLCTIMLTVNLSFGVEARSDVTSLGGKVLADFNSGAKVFDKTYDGTITLKNAKYDTSFAYNGKKGSLSWKFGNHNGFMAEIPYDASYNNSYDTLNFRYYTEISGQKIKLIINETTTFASSADNNYYNIDLVTQSGWNTFSVNLSDIKAKWAVEVPDYLYVYFISGWGLSTGTKEEFEAGSKNAIAGETMYIDSIWLAKDNTEKIVADFGVGAEIFNRHATYLSLGSMDTTQKYDENTSSFAWTIGDNSGIIIKLPYDGNWNYDNLKLRYKSVIPNQTFNIAINDANSFDSQSANPYWIGKLKTNGEWQESNIEVEYLKNKWANTPPEYIYILLETKYMGATAVNKDAFDSSKAQAIIGEKIYIDAIWLENRFGVASFEKNENGTNAVAILEAHRSEPLVLIAAVYTGSELDYVKTAYSETGAQSLTLSEDLVLEQGQTVKFMLWDSYESMCPYTASK